MNGAKTVVKHCLNIKPYQKVLIVTDRKLLNIGQALYDACREINFDTVLIAYRQIYNSGLTLLRW